MFCNAKLDKAIISTNNGTMNNAEQNNTTKLELMTCQQVADMLRVQVGTIYSWISYGQLDKSVYRKLGRKPIFIRSEVEKWFLAGAELKPRKKNRA